MRPTDQILARYSAELEERQQFMDGIVEAAENDGRDLNPQELELVTRTRDRIVEINGQIAPIKEAGELAVQSAETRASIAQLVTGTSQPRQVEYRSAGEYIMDFWRAGLGVEESINRQKLFHRAAAHQTTGDNPGLLPEQILGPVISYIDTARPLVNALGPRQLPSGSWSRPIVTQHTATAAQVGEKTELTSQKMVISKLPVSASTYGGYVNVSRQDIDWTQPQIMDIVIADLAGQYALDTENHACTQFTTAATVGPTLPATPDAADVAGALWGAAAQVIAGTGGQGTVIAVAPPALMGILGPLFPPVNPQNAQSQGFNTGALNSGPAGSISGIPVYVSGSMAANTILVLSTAAAEIYEDRIGALQVVEPSVLGVQVAYAGYFASLTLTAAGLSKIVKTP